MCEYIGEVVEKKEVDKRRERFEFISTFSFFILVGLCFFFDILIRFVFIPDTEMKTVNISMTLVLTVMT